MRRQSGQAMSEYLIVTMALVIGIPTAYKAGELVGLLSPQEEACAGYDNCITKLLSVVHDQYQGYGNAMTAVHRYPITSASVSGDSTDDAADGGEDGSSGSLDGIVDPVEGVSQQQVVTGSDGQVYGFAQADGSVFDVDGNLIGYYADDVFTPIGGESVPASAAYGIVDEDGNLLDPMALVDCETGDAAKFVYQSTVTGENYDTASLSPLDSEDTVGLCGPEATYQMRDTEGNIDEGGVIHGATYYASFLGDPVATGDVVLVAIAVDQDDEDYPEQFWGEVVSECGVIVTGWNADETKTAAQNYLSFKDQGAVLGTYAGDQGCPAETIISN